MPELQPQTSDKVLSDGPSLAGDGDEDALLHLRKMSTTAGVGSGDYVAINPVAIAATLLGVGALLVPILNYDLLQVIPLSAIVCAVIAWRQISRSNGTQTGKGLAVTGILLALAIGGGTFAFKTLTALKYQPETRQIASMVERLGSEVAQAGDAERSGTPLTRPTSGPTIITPAQRDRLIQIERHYHTAYLMFSDKFRSRVNEKAFQDVWSQLNQSGTWIRAMEWNGHIDFATDTGSGAPQATVVAWVHLNNANEPLREGIVFTKEAGVWEIDQMPFFPEKTGRR